MLCTASTVELNCTTLKMRPLSKKYVTVESDMCMCLQSAGVENLAQGASCVVADVCVCA